MVLRYIDCGGGGILSKDKKKEIIETDPFGSYTGRPKDGSEKPVQDADDL